MALVDDLALAHHGEVAENLSATVNLTSPRRIFANPKKSQPTEITHIFLEQPLKFTVASFGSQFDPPNVNIWKRLFIRMRYGSNLSPSKNETGSIEKANGYKRAVIE